MTATVGVVLAAGSSERMGQPKQLLKLHEKTLLSHVVETALSSSLDRVIVVLGPQAAEVRRDISHHPVTIVENPDPDRGNWSSLETALRILDPGDSVVVMLADMPEVTPDVVDRLVAAAAESDAAAAVSVYNDGIPNHPVLLGPAAQRAAASRTVPRRLWSVLVEDPIEAVVKVTIDRRPPIDVDTPEAYVELLRKAGAGPGPSD